MDIVARVMTRVSAGVHEIDDEGFVELVEPNR